MKKIRNTILAVVSGLMLASCVDLEEMNVDPNHASTTQPSLLLTGTLYTAFNQSSSNAAHATGMLVLTSGESVYQVYKWQRGGFDYYDNLRDVTKLQEEAEAGSAYQAIAKLLRANYFYQLTMDFGDIPYTEALKGESEEVYQPAYDSQETVMEGILKELAEADEILASSKDVISGDIIYSGDLTKWRKLVNAYRLRILITLSSKENAGTINIKNTFADIVANCPLMTSISDNGELTYLDQSGNRYYYFNDSDFGSGRYMSSTFVDAMKVREDPRLFVMVTQTASAEKAGKAIDDFTSYEGGNPAIAYSLVNDQAVAGNVSKPATRYYQNATNEPMILMGYTEQQLILAEGVARGWISGNDKEYYESAVKGSFEFYRNAVPDMADYLSETAAEKYLQGDKVAYTSSLSFSDKLERIAMQKYLPTFLQGSNWLPYYEALRTGTPNFDRRSGVELPYRWMYPLDEYNNNGDHVQAAITSQFGGNDLTSDKPWWIK